MPPTAGRALRYGTAEIELILAVVVMMTVMFLVLGAMRLGRARQEMAAEAMFRAVANATSEAVPLYGGDAELPPLEGTGALRPGLPSRTHVPRPRTGLTLSAGGGESMPTATIGGKAGMVAPDWTFSAYPVPDDQALTENWFVDYAAESHTFLSAPLRLAPAWAP